MKEVIPVAICHGCFVWSVVNRDSDKRHPATTPRDVVLGYSRVRLATEDELATLFPDCEVGTMPPFGNLYGLPVYVDELLAKDENIYFDAGTHEGAIKLRYQDFADVVHPQVAELHREPTKLEY